MACITRGSQPQSPQQNYQNIATESWYPPSVLGSNSGPSSSPSASSASGSHQRPQDYARPPSQSQPSPSEAASVISRLKDKR
jgi:ESCRT-I complex subunit VPS37